MAMSRYFCKAYSSSSNQENSVAFRREKRWARARDSLLMPVRLAPLKLFLGIVPGMDYPTGYPARSHHLGLPERRSQRLTANSIATTIDLITRCGGGACQPPAVGAGNRRWQSWNDCRMGEQKREAAMESADY
jgi:hypothetical protein